MNQSKLVCSVLLSSLAVVNGCKPRQFNEADSEPQGLRTKNSKEIQISCPKGLGLKGEASLSPGGFTQVNELYESGDSENVIFPKDANDRLWSAHFRIYKNSADEFTVEATTILNSYASSVSLEKEKKAFFYDSKIGYFGVKLFHPAHGQRELAFSLLKEDKDLKQHSLLISPHDLNFTTVELKAEERKKFKNFCDIDDCRTATSLWTEQYRVKNLIPVHKEALLSMISVQNKADATLKSKLGKDYETIEKIRKLRLERSDLEKRLSLATMVWLLEQCKIPGEFTDETLFGGSTFEYMKEGICKSPASQELSKKAILIHVHEGKNPFQIVESYKPKFKVISKVPGPNSKNVRAQIRADLVATMEAEAEALVALSKSSKVTTEMIGVAGNHFAEGHFDPKKVFYGFIPSTANKSGPLKDIGVKFVNGAGIVTQPSRVGALDSKGNDMIGWAALTNPRQHGSSVSLLGALPLAPIPSRTQLAPKDAFMPLPSCK